MSTEEIMKLMEAFRKNDLNSLTFEKDGERISLSREGREDGRRQSPGPAARTAETESAAGEPSPAAAFSGADKTAEDGCRTVTAPMVGTFYASPSPEKAPYVRVGDHVKKGQPVGVIEAMKLMNEIESAYDGVVEEILVRNESLVEYGQPLVRIREGRA